VPALASLIGSYVRNVHTTFRAPFLCAGMTLYRLA
jgi:hypothetical protein